MSLAHTDRSIPLKRNAILPECLQLLAPRDERHVSPALLQARPVIAADSARTHDRDLQGALPCCLFAAADRYNWRRPCAAAPIDLLSIGAAV